MTALCATIFGVRLEGTEGGKDGKDELKIFVNGEFVGDLLLGGGYACFCIFPHPSFKEIRLALVREIFSIQSNELGV